MDFWQVNITLLQGFGSTCVLFFVTLLLAIPLGLVVAMGSMSQLAPLRWLTRTFVWVIRGTPLMLQISVVFYVPGLVFGIQTGASRMVPALTAFVINYAAYFSEIYRGGIQSISNSQYEAGLVLGMTRREIFFRVVLLQVVKRILPAMSNEVITLIKDTSLARVIGVVELLKEAEHFAQYGLIWPLFYTGVFYLVFSGVVTLLFRKAEQKLEFFKG